MYRLITCTCITMPVPYTQTIGTTLVHQPANINGSLFPPYRLTSFKPTSLNFRSFPNKNITSFRSTRIYSTRGHVQHFFSNYTIVGGDARRDKAFLLTHMIYCILLYRWLFFGATAPQASGDIHYWRPILLCSAEENSNHYQTIMALVPNM